MSDLFAGRYRLDRKLGVGGSAEVWTAWFRAHPDFEKQVAVKIMHQDEGSWSDDSIKSFVNEAKLGAALQHPCVGSIFDFGVVDGVPYIAMEFVQGLSLRGWLDASGGSGVQVSAAIEVAYQVSRALAYAHAWTNLDGRPQPVVHRDIKPENIMLGWNSEVRLLDYGIARWEGNVHRTTGTGVIKGTPQYMSPEQITRPSSVGPPCDRFALGTVILEMFSGRNPYHSENFRTTLGNVVQRKPRIQLEQLATAAPQLAELVAQLIRKNPADRIADTNQIRRQLFELRRVHPLPVELGDFIRQSITGDERTDGVFVASTLRIRSNPEGMNEP
jgi:serine/threonine protein kinase